MGGVVWLAMCGAMKNWKVAAMPSRVKPTPMTSPMRTWRRRNFRMSQIPMAEPMTDMTPLATCAVMEAEVDMPAYSSTLGA